MMQFIFLVTGVSWALPFNLSKCFIWHFWWFCGSPGTEANIYISLLLVAELQIFPLGYIEKLYLCLVGIFMSTVFPTYLFKIKTSKQNLLTVPKREPYL